MDTKTTFKTLKTNYPNDEHTFFIAASGEGYKLYVDPPNRHNGTQSLDGYYPRYFKSVRAAKSSLTKYLGKPPPWQEA